MGHMKTRETANTIGDTTTGKREKGTMEQISTTTETQIDSDISWETIREGETLGSWDTPEKREAIEKEVALTFGLSLSSFRYVKAEFVDDYMPRDASQEEARAAVRDLFVNRHLISAPVYSCELEEWAEEFFGADQILNSTATGHLASYIKFDHLAALADCKLNGDLFIIEEELPGARDRECSYRFAKSSTIHVFHIED